MLLAPPIVEIRWRSPRTAERLERIAASVARDGRSKASEMLGRPGRFLIGSMLPVAGEDPRVFDLRVSFDPAKADLDWHLTARARPAGEPPASVVEANERIGGPEGWTTLVEESLGDSHAVGAYKIHAHVSAVEFDCRLLPPTASTPQIPDALADFASEFELDQVGFRVVEGAVGVARVEFGKLHGYDEYCLDVEARAAVTIRDGDRWLPYATETSRLVAARFFTRRSTEAAHG